MVPVSEKCVSGLNLHNGVNNVIVRASLIVLTYTIFEPHLGQLGLLCVGMYLPKRLLQIGHRFCATSP
jgi:hypothetical protein